MKKHILLLFIFTVTFSNSVFAEEFEIVAVNDSNVSGYYYHVYKAEGFIIRGYIDSALYQYAEALRFRKRYNSDIYNINKCFLACENEKNKIHILLETFKYAEDTITIDKFINGVSSYLSEYGLNELKNSIKRVKKYEINDNINYEMLTTFLEVMLYDDQEYRGEGDVTGVLNENRQKQDEINFKKLMKLYSNYGNFHTENLRGMAFLAYKSVLTHNFYYKKKYEKYNKFFINEVKHGRLDARVYASIVDNYKYDSTQVYGIHTLLSVGDSLIVFNLSEQAKHMINLKRSEIFLQDIETTQKKLIWQWKHAGDYFFEMITEYVPYYREETATTVAHQYLVKFGSLSTGFEIISH